MDRKNWVFTPQQLQHLNDLRQKTFKPNYTENDERQLLNYHVLLSVDLIKFLKDDEIYQILCYSAQLFKRIYLRNSIFHQKSLEQNCITCMYLGLKLYERKEENIREIAKRLKVKPKFQTRVHYEDKGYGQQEIRILELLNHEIQISQYYQTIMATNHLLDMHGQLESFVYNGFQVELKKFYVRSLFDYTVFLHKAGNIAIAVIECALLQICNSLFNQQMHQHMRDRPTHLISQKVQTKIKQALAEFQNSDSTLFLLYFVEGQSQVIQQIRQKLEQNTEAIKAVVQMLKQTKDIESYQGSELLKKYQRALNDGEFTRPLPIQRPHRTNSDGAGDYHLEGGEPRKMIKQ